MNHADPWDEMARLQKQMDVELLKQLRDAKPDGRRKLERQDPVPEDKPEH